ncbi:MAG: histidinol-phosphatase, partial [Clostridiaceae bacterium]
YMNSKDEVIGEEEKLLITASNIGVYDTALLCSEYGGIAIPAHIDRSSYSILSMLGFITEDMGFSTYELSLRAVASDLLKENKLLEDKIIIRNSDAHYLWDIAERERFIELTSISAKSIIEYFSEKND